ncbi:hypothetical protein BC943DRAFT_288000 [Umbelopsis sp. AD052]|nr:hypothetical protein BC943DRAFT_288000 [Umbelopsis sp. AD052]
MATRLDRLVLLLDTGSTAAVRQTAAQQLGEIQKQHPTELYNLLTRVIVHLRSKSWETRVAAGQAIEAIAANVPEWNPPEDMKIEDSNSPPPIDTSDIDTLSFATFDLSSVLVHGKLLLGSAGKEYDIDMSDMTPQERLALQRKNLKERLGLGSQFMDVDLLDDFDVSSEAIKDTPSAKSTMPPPPIQKSQPETPPPATTPAVAQINMAGLSARERNMLKRKMKQDAKNKSKDKVRMLDLQSQRQPETSEPKSFATPSPVKVESESNLENYDITPQPQSDKIVVESKAPPPDALTSEVPRNEWPFETVCEHLCMDLFDPAWEIRHGAGIGLRSVLKNQGNGAGKRVGLTIQANEHAHNQWLEDVAIRLLCLFILDRFADFVSDQVVCPVRETCSQTLGILLQYMAPESVKQVHGILLQLIKQDHGSFKQKSIWEIRHAGLLGLKYAVAVRKDLVDMLMDGTTDAVILGLCDHDDDVRAVSASTLLPVTAEFVKLSSKERIRKLIGTLWDCLTDLKDDLTASTGAVMDLIAKLFEQETVMDIVREGHSLNTLVPRLYPFFRHIITSVRMAVLNTFITLLECKTGNEWVEENVYRLVFQNLIVEERDDVLARTIAAWEALTSTNNVTHDVILQGTQNWMGSWFEITMTPVGQPLEVTTHFYKPAGAFGSGGGAQLADTKATNGKAKGKNAGADDDKGGYNLDAGMVLQDFSLVTPEKVMRGRVAAATALGKIMSIWPDETMEMSYYDVLIALLSSSWASKRQLAAMVIEEWAKAVMRSRFNIKFHGDGDRIVVLAESISFANRLSKVTVSSLENDGVMQTTSEQQQQGLPQGYFYELVFVLKRIRAECQSLLNAFVLEGKVAQGKVPSLPALVVGEVAISPDSPEENLFSVETAAWVADACFDTLVGQIGKVRGKPAVISSLEDRRKRIVTSIGFYDETKQRADTNILASLAGAVVALGVLPVKLNPVIRSVMNSIKFEQNHEFQRRSASTLASLLAICSKGQVRINPNDKIVKNLCTFLCSDPLLTPVFADNQQLGGIQSLQKPDAPAQAKASKESSAANSQLSEQELMRRGAETALKELCDRFGEHLFQEIPKVWECMAGKLQGIYGEQKESSAIDANSTDDLIAEETNVGQEIIDSLTVIRTVLPVLHESLWSKVVSIAPYIAETLKSRYSFIRFAGARCLATLCNVMTVDGMRIIVERAVPMLGDTRNDAYRQGASEVIYHLVQLLDAKILPYVIFLIVPILGRMSDLDESVRLVCTNCFALLIKLVPLEAGIPDPPGMSQELLAHRDEERKFLSQLMDPSKIETFVIPVKINAELRKYQQEGVSWLAFLNKFHLHGILCDDMGLGKTLQSICILASDHENRATAYAQGRETSPCPPSLVICPPTLSGHWYHEIKNYTNTMKPLMYTGGPAERKRLRSKIKDHDIIIMSYDIIRNDIEDLQKMPWNYCILDEGHIIKNGKTKITKAIKSIRADHRLILSGTPIQNNVLELWSLFDFLMPGFLGTEKIFNDRFGKPILASRDSKSSSKEQEAGALALEALHKQVLPFLLRRLKEDVLHDLPPKIIQDYYCELSDLQASIKLHHKSLYEEFSKSQAKNAVEHELESESDEKEGGGKAQHIFQALQYLRKLCNHPLLVVNPKHPEYNKVMQRLEKNQASLHDIHNAPKLLALKQLLVDCGIGATTNETETDPAAMAAGAVSQHRALIFCQLKTMLDIIEDDILKKLMPSVTYLRLDGSIDATKRHDIVQKFNADPSIDLLLLTTHVGGLGLNLTGADTVIFVEHDWNPMKDLQAMDRAHRIGQKKVVNVYRLITRGTLEEKIMGLQKFKLNIANTIVNQQNSGLQSMDSNQILDLFSVPGGNGEEKPKKDTEGEIAKRVGPKAVLDNLESLWDEKQYEEEYNIDNFISNLK